MTTLSCSRCTPRHVLPSLPERRGLAVQQRGGAAAGRREARHVRRHPPQVGPDPGRRLSPSGQRAGPARVRGGGTDHEPLQGSQHPARRLVRTGEFKT